MRCFSGCMGAKVPPLAANGGEGAVEAHVPKLARLFGCVFGEDGAGAVHPHGSTKSQDTPGGGDVP